MLTISQLKAAVLSRFGDAICVYDPYSGIWYVSGDDRDRSQGPGWPDAAGPVVLGSGPSELAAWRDAYELHVED